MCRQRRAAAPANIASHSATAIILFADIADSTALTERMGDAAFREKARALDDALRTAMREHGGTAIDGKLLGDGILATFPAASQAIAAALALDAAGDAHGPPLHIGLHAGDVIRERPRPQNVYGGAVNIAARISALAAPGEVFVSRTVARSRPHLRRRDVRGPRRARPQGHRRAAARVRRARSGGGVMEPHIQYARTTDGVASPTTRWVMARRSLS